MAEYLGETGRATNTTADGGGTKQVDWSDLVEAGFCEDDRWLLRRLGVVPPVRVPHLEWVQLCDRAKVNGASVSVHVFLNGTVRQFWLRIWKDGFTFRLDSKFANLFQCWPIVEAVTSGMVLMREVEHERPLPLVRLGPGGDFTRDINPEPRVHPPTVSLTAGGAA